MSAAGHPRVHPKTRAEWRAWLRAHHRSAAGVWFVSYKRSAGKPRVEYEDAVQEALCFGWIDSMLKPVDATRSSLLFTPRKARSGWSSSNKRRVKQLIADGRMTAAGLAKIEVAKRDGSWTLLDRVEAMRVPPDLARALGTRRGRRFDALAPSPKKQLLWWVATAKRPETRAKRIADIAARMAT